MTVRVFIAGVVSFAVMAYMEYLVLVSVQVYQMLWWWDIPMHIIGGMWAGFIAVWFPLMQKRAPSLAQCIVFALLCGVAIEILEYFSGLGGNPYMPYWVDTIKDLVDDLIGGYLAWRLFLALRTV